MAPVLRRLVSASRIPFGFAAVLSLYVLTVGRRAAESLGLSTAAVVVAYFGIALIVAVLVAVLGAWATSRARGTAVGYLAGMVLTLVANYTLIPMAGDPPLVIWKLIIVMLFMGVPGAIVGAMYWEPGTGRESGHPSGS